MRILECAGLYLFQNMPMEMAWYGMVWYDYGMVWHGMVWYGMVWYGMVWLWLWLWYSMAWYDMVWYGMVWCGMISGGFVLGQYHHASYSLCLPCFQTYGPTHIKSLLLVYSGTLQQQWTNQNRQRDRHTPENLYVTYCP